MRHVLVELTEELVEALDIAKGDESRNAFIERCLWKIGAVKKAAKALGLKKPARRKAGRPKVNKKSKG